MCLIWPGCGSRLQSEGHTPQTWSPETSCESTTLFSSITQVRDRSDIIPCFLSEAAIINWNVDVCVSDGESRLGCSDVLKLGNANRKRQDYMDPYHQLSSQRSTVQDGQSSLHLKRFHKHLKNPVKLDHLQKGFNPFNP